jgi:hypothetical protein
MLTEQQKKKVRERLQYQKRVFQKLRQMTSSKNLQKNQASDAEVDDFLAGLEDKPTSKEATQKTSSVNCSTQKTKGKKA